MNRLMIVGCLAALVAGGAFADGAKLVVERGKKLADLKPGDGFAMFTKAIGSDGAAFLDGWKYLTTGGNVLVDSTAMKAKFDDPEKKLKSVVEYRSWVYRAWIWAGEEGAKTSFTIEEADMLPCERKVLVPYLVDLVTMTATPLPEADIIRDGTKFTFRNLPVKATPMALATRYQLEFEGGNLRDWKVSAKVEPEDKILFKVGEKPELVIRVTDKDGRPVSETGAKMQLRWYRSYDPFTNEVVALDGKEIRRSMALDKPGAVTCDVSLRVAGYIGDTEPKRLVPVPVKKENTGHLGADGKNNAVKMKEEDFGRIVGCVFDWDKIGPARPAPKDIDEVWDKLLEEDAKLPFELKKCELVRTTKTGVKVYRIVLNSLAGDVHAEMSIPKEADEGKKFPIWCIFQAYGCANMWTWPWEWAITIAPNTHSIENGREGAYYSKLSGKDGPLNNYGFDEKTNAKFETTYFRGILLRDVRAVRYMMSRAEWDHKQVMYYGSSQGGYQSVALLGLIPETTKMELICPWSVEFGGSQCHWRPKWGEGIQYCDPLNLAHRAKGAGKVVAAGLGVADDACPVDGIFAWINALPKDVDLTVSVFQNKGHNVEPGDKHYCVEIRRKPNAAVQIVPHFDRPRVYAD